MRVSKLLLAAALAAAAVGCAPNPIIARDPIPPPNPAFAYSCNTQGSFGGTFYGTACRPAPPPPVVRAKG